MTTSSARRSKTTLVALLLTSGFAVRAQAESTEEEDDNNFREDVILCEEAVAHVTTCCGYAVQSDACRYYHYSYRADCGCSGYTGSGRTKDVDVWPVLDVAQSRSLADVSCAALKTPNADGRTACETLYDEIQAANERSSESPSTCESL